MVNGQAKMDVISRSATSDLATSAAKSEAEIINYIQQAFAEKNSALLQMERHQQGQAHKLDQLHSEASSILGELHRTQELLEEAQEFREKASKDALLQAARIRKLKALLPDHWEVELTALKRTKKGAVETLQWSLNNIYLNDNLIPSLQLETHLSKGEVGVVIKNKFDKDGQRWLESAHGSSASEVRIFPHSGSVNEGSNLEISALGTTDWDKTKQLIAHLGQFVKTTATKDKKFEKADLAGLSAGLTALQQKLMDWPWVFRFDQVKLNDTLQTHEYHRLSIKLLNFSVGNYRWPKLEYNLATVDHLAGFGQNPRLEFPEASKGVIKNWYAETSDGRGPRLELRFALPSAFDWTVWGKLDSEDHLLITALVSSLPLQIAAVEKQGSHADDWEEWKRLCHNLKAILSNQLRAVVKAG